MRGIAAVIVVLCVGGTPARAAEEPAAVEAKRHFDEGTKLFNLGEFAHAATEYRAAYKAKPDPVFLYNIAQALRLNNDLANSVFFYRSYLRNAGHPPNQKEVERRINELETQIARQKAVTTAPPNEPYAPGAPVPAPTAEPAPPPATTPPATTPPATTPPPAAEPAPVVASAPVAERKPLYKKWWLWAIVGGVVVVGVAVGVGVGVGTHSASAPSSHFGTVLSF